MCKSLLPWKEIRVSRDAVRSGRAVKQALRVRAWVCVCECIYAVVADFYGLVNRSRCSRENDIVSSLRS